MRRHWNILIGLVVLVGLGAFLFSRTTSPTLKELEEVRRSLRQAGFKIELGEFDFSLTPEQRRRAELLGTTTRAGLTNRLRPSPILGDMSDFPASLTPVGDRKAIPAWKFQNLKGYRGDAIWPEVRETLDASKTRLDAAREAAVSGPIRFEPIGSEHPYALLPYLADLKNLETTFGVLTLLALHDGRRDAAWTNLLAATCLATAYDPEPIDVSHSARIGLVSSAYDTTWSALPAEGWTEEQLASLQKHWESLEFFDNLPETAAYSRANMAGICKLERQQPLLEGMSVSEAIRHPKEAWSELVRRLSHARERYRASYEDEKAFLVYYRDRELELRTAVHAATWKEMRQLPGVTNFVPFRSSGYSPAVAHFNMRQLSLTAGWRGAGILGGVAAAEARRRLVVTALALERYRGRHARYPDALKNLVPELLAAAPLDFMDGEPLRYHVSKDGHFLLYSVGLDCVDNGGAMRRPKTRGKFSNDFDRDFGYPEGTDLVWALPASTAEIEHFEEETRQAEETRKKDLDDAQADAWWNITTRRQASVETIFACPPALITNEPVYRGRRLSGILSNRPGTNDPGIFELLALKQVVTGAEPETVTFELPIKYEVLTNLGELVLCIDRYGPDYEEGWAVGQYECQRATNGDCRLVWSTIYEPPGKHALLASLDLKKPGPGDDGLFGPVTPFVVTNLCQFTPESAIFDPDQGAKLYGRLPETNCVYKVALNSPAGECLKTFRGSTTNGFIEVHWDLVDDHGRRCTNESYDSIFEIALPDSGRSQRLKGP